MLIKSADEGAGGVATNQVALFGDRQYRRNDIAICVEGMTDASTTRSPSTPCRS